LKARLLAKSVAYPSMEEEVPPWLRIAIIILFILALILATLTYHL